MVPRTRVADPCHPGDRILLDHRYRQAAASRRQRDRYRQHGGLAGHRQRHRLPVDPPRRQHRARRGGDEVMDVVQDRRPRDRHRFAHRRPIDDGAFPCGLHLHAGPAVLHRVRPRRPSFHSLLRCPHPVLGRHAHDGVGTQHGPADSRLGDHGSVLVHAHWSLVGGARQQRGCTQGLLDRPGR